jgi:hypothetical protein
MTVGNSLKRRDSVERHLVFVCTANRRAISLLTVPLEKLRKKPKLVVLSRRLLTLLQRQKTRKQF